MPIKPENRKRYPADWPQIRARIRARAGDACERCGLRNYDVGYRYFGFSDTATSTSVWQSVVPARYWTDGKPWTHKHATEFRDAWNAAYRPHPMTVVIVCTTAHLAEPIEDCRDENLMFMCQRCHNQHDAQMRRANARETRRERRAVGELPGVTPVSNPAPDSGSQWQDADATPDSTR